MTINISNKIRFYKIDSGLSRIYYYRSGVLYCFQEDAPDDFVLYLCSADGEPVGPVKSSTLFVENLPADQKLYDTEPLYRRFWNMILSFRNQK